MLLNKKYRRTQRVAGQGERRIAFKTTIGKHQAEENTGILVAIERNVLSKPIRIVYEGMKCIKLRYFCVTS